MNKRLLVTDLISIVSGLVFLVFAILMKSFNQALLTDMIILISFAIFLTIIGVIIMIVSYKDNTEKVSIGNLLLHLFLGIAFFVIYSIPTVGLSSVNGVGNSICIAITGIFVSRFAFSFSKFLKERKTAVELTSNKPVTTKPFYSRNMSAELHEIMHFFGYICLIACDIGLLYNTIYPRFNIAMLF